MVWFKACGFWHTILTGCLLEFWGILCLGDLAGIISQDRFLQELQKDLDTLGDKVGQAKAQMWAWVLARSVRWSHWGHLPRWWSQLPYMHVLSVGSSSPVVRGGGLSCCTGQ